MENSGFEFFFSSVSSQEDPPVYPIPSHFPVDSDKASKNVVVIARTVIINTVE